jgi:prevent-host-death family protein
VYHNPTDSIGGGPHVLRSALALAAAFVHSNEETGVTMENVTLADAKAHLEDLIERASRGEDVRIVDAKIDSIRLTPIKIGEQAARKPRRLGLLEGKMKVPADLMDA